ncbi:MAG: phosphoribosylamine--glycine ligase [Chloroflexi bacterium]|nr:phosphoribosylamine--glycine ligase [Chloroflexota bacterium]
MRILVVGNGAREHAITWKMAQSPSCPALFVAPGNAGTAQIAENIPIDAEDIDSLLQYVTANDIDLTFVGPEVPLAAGIVDRFEGAGCLVFGPTQRAARIESSKSFAKDVMASAGIPTAAAQVFDNTIDALAYIESTEPPYVIKADGLAAGKGVIMASERADATTAIRAMMDDNSFGAAGKTILIEEWLMGQEVSVFAFVDGEYVSPMVAACDYKRVGDGDTGPNTGGMGSYSPPPFWNGDLDEEVRRRIVEPVVKELARVGSPFRGVLFTGLMLTDSGAKVIEFNCRLGDPEAQVVLPRLQSDLLEIVHRTTLGELDQTEVIWNDVACVGVVSASAGYPESYKTGYEIAGLDAVDPSTLVFHAGTRPSESTNPVTSGGRVLTVTGIAKTLADASAAAYDNTARIVFDGRFHRNDIAANL